MTLMDVPKKTNVDGSPVLSFRQGLAWLLLGLCLSWIVTNFPSFLESSSVVSFVSGTASDLKASLLVSATTSGWFPGTAELVPTTTATTITKTRRLQEQTTKPGPPRVQFVFTMGLIGDGAQLHQVLGKTIAKSPAMQLLVDLGIAPKQLLKLHQLLYQNIVTGDPKKPLRQPGLWNAHCQVNKTKADAQGLHNQIVKLLKDIQEIVNKAHASGKLVVDENNPYSSVIPIPINTVLFRDVQNESQADKTIELNYGMVTYPTQFRQNCHRLDFPSLDLWYATCQDAQVDCRHIFLYRPPLHELHGAFSYLQAVQKKNNPQKTFSYHLAEIHLHNTMLHVMADEMHQYAPRTIGCLDIAAGTWKDTWLELWWGSSKDSEEAKSLLDSMIAESASVFPQKDVERKDLGDVLPLDKAAPYVESYLQLHQAARDACHETFRQVEAFLSGQDPFQKQARRTLQ